MKVSIITRGERIFKNDESGQFILLMSIIVAIGLVILLIFFNQSMMGGHSSSQSIMDFPKDDIREFRTETVDQAQYLGLKANGEINSTDIDDYNKPDAFYKRFNNSFDSYIVQIKDIYAREGTSVNATYSINLDNVTIGNESDGNINYLYPAENMTIILYYNNGETSYDYNSTIYLE